MANDATMMRRLLWKDAITIKPMVLAIMIAMVSLNLVFLIVSPRWEVESVGAVLVGLWILMPNLVAIGAPALLVGSEEEAGTLSWLRTLPMRWQQVADSKFIVSLSAVLAAWVIATLLVVASLGVIPGTQSPLSDDLLSVAGVLQLSFFSLLLLLCGFITAYAVRSPLTALISLVPLIVIVSSLSMDVGRWILFGNHRFMASKEMSPGQWLLVITLGITTLIVFWIAQRLLARRRLVMPQSAIRIRPALQSFETLRPPPARAGLDQPSRWSAMLWQQWRQFGWPGVALCGVMAAFFILTRFVERGSMTTLSILSAYTPLVIGLGASWLGGLTFYGDNVRRRCTFFADRGISTNLIWWTRLSIPALSCGGLVILQLGLIAGANDSRYVREAYFMACMLVVMFAFGQLVAQWTPRATLTFFAAPAYAVVSMVASHFLLPFSPFENVATLLIAPVLLWATWRMKERWLTGRVDNGFHWRFVAYTVFAVALPSLAIVSHRLATLPFRYW